MLEFLQKKTSKKFDNKTLIDNDIKMLVTDYRWNSLFELIEKPHEIKILEDEFKKLLLKEESLEKEFEDMKKLKKESLELIINLTQDVFDKKQHQARERMDIHQKRINSINDRFNEIDEELVEINHYKKDINLQLLELLVDNVYTKIKSDSVRINELESYIQDTREKFKSYHKEKKELSKKYTDIYTYFHDLLGAKEVEKLDKEYLKNDR